MYVNYSVKTLKQKSNRKATRVYLTLSDKKQIMQDCNDAALILFEFYLSKSGIDNYEYTDAQAAYALGWTIRKVQENRKLLTRKGYFFQRKGKYVDKTSILTTYLGKDIVREIKKDIEASTKAETKETNEST